MVAEASRVPVSSWFPEASVIRTFTPCTVMMLASVWTPCEVGSGGSWLPRR